MQLTINCPSLTQRSGIQPSASQVTMACARVEIATLRLSSPPRPRPVVHATAVLRSRASYQADSAMPSGFVIVTSRQRRPAEANGDASEMFHRARARASREPAAIRSCRRCARPSRARRDVERGKGKISYASIARRVRRHDPGANAALPWRLRSREAHSDARDVVRADTRRSRERENVVR